MRKLITSLLILTLIAPTFATDTTADFSDGNPLTASELNNWKEEREGDLLPISGSTYNYESDTHDLGSATYKWQDLHLNNDAFIGGILQVNDSNPRLQLLGTTTDFLLQNVDSNGRLRVYNDTTDSEDFTILSNGKVGIGTSSPSNPLTVKASSLGAYAIAHEDTDGNNMGGWFINSLGNGEWYIKDSTHSTAILLNSDGDSYLNGGNVGFGTSSPSYFGDFAKSNSGATNILAIRNTSNTASSAAQLLIQTAGTSAGDAIIQWAVSGTTQFYGGIDNSDSDNWKLSRSSDLSNESMKIFATSGEVAFAENTRLESNGDDIYLRLTNGVGDFYLGVDSVEDDDFKLSRVAGLHNESMVVDSSDGTVAFPNYDVGVGSKTKPTSNGGKTLFFGDNTSDPTMATNTAGIYGKDVSGTVEMFAVDEAGNSTQLSSHDPDTGEWRFYSKNTKTGRVVEVNLESFFKHYDKVNGTNFFHESLEL